jgi:beta-xylosidase
VGSIDPFFVRDERGRPYLVWKADGNDAEPDAPTSVYAQRLSADGTRLVGSRREILRNTEPWERHVTEGSYILRRGGWFYHFYSGNACCGRGCDYALGVARARKLLGPWEKNPANPILAENNVWQCPGHGSIVTNKQGKDYLLYHAYRKSDVAFHIGREALLDEVKWKPDGWPSINDGRGPSTTAARPPSTGVVLSQDSFYDEFDAPAIAASWQWLQSSVPAIAIETGRGGRLKLSAPDRKSKDPLAAVVTQRAPGGNYTATTGIDLAGQSRGASAGLSAYSDRENALGVTVGGGEIKVWRMESKGRRTVATAKTTAQVVSLRMTAKDGAHYRFSYSVDGKTWTPIGDEVDGTHLGYVRIALNVGGATEAAGTFEWLRIDPTPPEETMKDER